MEENLYLCSLYDCYSKLLTEKQCLYFEDYYFNNLSLSEMSENYNISRNAIHKTIKEVNSKLIEFEEKLKLHEKNNRLLEIIKDIDDKNKKRIEEIINGG